MEEITKQTTKPKSLLPNGKTNPEYRKWYANTEKGMIALKKYRKTEWRKISRQKWDKNNRRKKIDFEIERNNKSRLKAKLNGKPWCVVDECYLMDNVGTITIRVMAEKLGRTIKACEQRIQKIRKEELEQQVLTALQNILS